MAANPSFTATVAASPATISTANTARDGTGDMSIIYEAGLASGNTDGGRVDGVAIEATSTTTDGMIRLFISEDNTANTTSNTRLVHEISVSAITPSGTVKAFQAVERGTGLPSDVFPLFLKDGETLRVSTNNAEEFEVRPYAGDF